MELEIFSPAERLYMLKILTFRRARLNLSLLQQDFDESRKEMLSTGHTEDRLIELLEFVSKMEKEDRVAELEEQL